MTGVGVSTESMDNAENAARVNLFKQIRVDIIGEETSTQMEISQTIIGLPQGKNQTVVGSSKVKGRLTTRVQAILSGLNISERWSNVPSRLYYALATLDRDAAASQLQTGSF